MAAGTRKKGSKQRHIWSAWFVVEYIQKQPRPGIFLLTNCSANYFILVPIMKKMEPLLNYNRDHRKPLKAAHL